MSKALPVIPSFRTYGWNRKRWLAHPPNSASGDRIGAKTQPPLCANVLKCPQYHPTGFLGSQSFLSSSRSAVSSQAPPQYGYSA